MLSERTYDYLLYTKDVTAFYDEGNIWDETKIHTYSMYKEGDEEHYGAMLMGMESDAHGVMNQMGHTHDIHATPEKASSFGGQRTDEVGNKYGGRQCDLSKKSAREITRWMTALERKMQEWQSQPDEADYAAPLLTGEAVEEIKAGMAFGMALVELLEEMESAMDGMLTYVTAAFSPQMDGLEQLFTRVGFVIEEESAVTSWQIPLKKLMGSLLFARRVPAPGRCMLRTLEHAQDLDLRQLVEKLPHICGAQHWI
uniref:hypothetical protein n=1 Tax=Agathobacter sp. TaxID=2021311 RepID=UPI004027320A